MPDPYIYLWAYEVSPEMVDDFYELYGPEGAWVALFRRAPGYLDTELIVDRNQPSRFVTIDRWKSKEAFDSFRTKFGRDYTPKAGGRTLDGREWTEWPASTPTAAESA